MAWSPDQPVRAAHDGQGQVGPGGRIAIWPRTSVAIRGGAARVVGLDPEACPPDALAIALDRLGLGHRLGDVEQIAATTLDAGDIGAFDYVMSNNVLEYVYGLSHTLASLRRFLPAVGGRIAIFADPLFLSSHGHHLRAGPWEHLTLSQESLRERVPPRQWQAYRETLNGMTITGFLDAVREAGLILLDLEIVPDRELPRFAGIWPHIPPGLKPMDLCLEGIACTLAFPHNVSAP